MMINPHLQLILFDRSIFVNFAQFPYLLGYQNSMIASMLCKGWIGEVWRVIANFVWGRGELMDVIIPPDPEIPIRSLPLPKRQNNECAPIAQQPVHAHPSSSGRVHHPIHPFHFHFIWLVSSPFFLFLPAGMKLLVAHCHLATSRRGAKIQVSRLPNLRYIPRFVGIWIWELIIIFIPFSQLPNHTSMPGGHRKVVMICSNNFNSDQLGPDNVFSPF